MHSFVNKSDYSKRTEEKKKEQEEPNIFNMKVLDTILDDDSDQFLQLISDHQDINYEFNLTNYKLPEILRYKPPIAGVCLVFNSEKCFYTLVNQIDNGIRSEKLKKKDEMGRSLMHFCAFGGNLTIFHELCQADYDINEADNTRKTPSHYSAISGTIDIMRYIILDGVDIFSNDKSGLMTPLDIACLYGNFEIVKFICENAGEIDLIERDSNCNSTPLHFACEGGNESIVKYFLKNEVILKHQINSLNNEGRSPLLIAVEFGNLECLKVLIQTGKAKQFFRGHKHVALIDAVIAGHKDIVLFLLKNGADIKMTNYKKLTALDVAIKYDDIGIARILIEHGAMSDFDEQKLADLFVKVLETLDFEMINFFNDKFDIPYLTKGDMFIGRAVQLENEELVDYLLSKNCTLDNIGQYISFNGKWKPFMNFLKAKGMNVSGIESENGVPLIVKSIKSGNLKYVKKMIAEGSKLTAKIIDDNDCIMSTCIKGNYKLFNFLLTFKPNMKNSSSYLYNLLNHYDDYKDSSKEKIIKKRIKMAETLMDRYKANPNQTEIIREAAIRGNFDILKLFAKYHANFNQCNIDESKLSGEVLRFLKSHGFTDKVQRRNIIQIANMFHYPIPNSLLHQNSTQNQNNNQDQLPDLLSIFFMDFKKK